MARSIEVKNNLVETRDDGAPMSDTSNVRSSSRTSQRFYDEDRKRRTRITERVQTNSFMKHLGSRSSTPSTAHSSSSASIDSMSDSVSRSSGLYQKKRVSGGVHNRLYARSKARQEEGKEKREQIAKSLAPKPVRPPKKISAKKASSLYDRLYDNGVQKQISLGRKKNAPDGESVDDDGSAAHISNTEAEDLYKRLYSDAMTKQIKDMKMLVVERPKVKVISPRQANSLYERLYGETTSCMQRAKTVKD